MDNRYSSSRSNYIFRGFTDHSTGEKENSFYFQKRGGKIDWKKIAAIDVDNVEREYNITVLQDNIDNFVFCCIESEIDVKSINPLFIKLFKVGQLIAEYLLHSQDHLVTIIEKMQQKSPKPGNELLKERNEYNAENEHSHLHQRSKKASNKNPTIDQVNSAISCTFCYKVFESSKYLIKHVMRRHPEELAAGIKSVNDRNDETRTLTSQKQVIDFMAKEIGELKESLKEEIGKNFSTVVQNLNKERNGALDETNVVQLIDRWKQQEEEKQQAQLGKMKREFTNELRNLKLAMSDSENAVQNVEEKFLMSLETVKKDLIRVTGAATSEFQNECKTEFSKIRNELQNQLATSHEAFLAKLEHQDSRLRDRMAEIRRENDSELQNLKYFLETTLSKLSAIDDIYELQKKLEQYLELCHARSQRKAWKKHCKTKPKGHSNHSQQSLTQSTSSKSGCSIALKDNFHTIEGTGKIGTTRSDDDVKKSKSAQNLEAVNSKWAVINDTTVSQHHDNIDRNSDTKSRDMHKDEMTGTPIMVRPVIAETRPKTKSHESSSLNGTSVIQREFNKDVRTIETDRNLDPSSGMKVLNASKNDVDVPFVIKPSDSKKKAKAKPNQSSAPVGSSRLQQLRNCDVNGIVAPDPIDKESESPGIEKADEETDSVYTAAEVEEFYHVTKRLENALRESPDLVEGLHSEILALVNDKMKRFNISDSYVSDTDFSSKIMIISSEIQSLAASYPDFLKIRNWYDDFASHLATSSLHKEGGGKRRITFASPEVTAEVEASKRSSSEEADELHEYPDQRSRQPPKSSSSGYRESCGTSSASSEGKPESTVLETRSRQSITVGTEPVRKLPPKPDSVVFHSSPKSLHSDLPSESSVESLGYTVPFKENLHRSKEQEEYDELESISVKELSSFDGSDLSSHSSP